MAKVEFQEADFFWGADQDGIAWVNSAQSSLRDRTFGRAEPDLNPAEALPRRSVRIQRPAHELEHWRSAG